MGLIEDELNKALHSPVRRKANTAKNLRSLAGRISDKKAVYTEVMVKITSFGTVGERSPGSKLSSSGEHMSYIARNGKLEIENERGELIVGKRDVTAYFKDWESDFLSQKRRINQRDTMHLILSMPDSVSPNDVRDAARSFAKEVFSGNHEYVMALHHPGNDKDAKQPHVHLDVKCRGFDGKQLNPRKADLQEWREIFSEKLEELGVSAVATSCRSRGVAKTNVHSAVWHMQRTDKTHKAPRVPRVVAQKSKTVSHEIETEANGGVVPGLPWVIAANKRWHTVKSAYLKAADMLEADMTSKDVHNDNKRLADNLRAFAARMRPIVTERDTIKADLLAKFSKQPEHQQTLTRDGAERTAPKGREHDRER